MATWTLGDDGLWRDPDGNVADEVKADALVTKAMSGNPRTPMQNIAGGAGRGVVGIPAMLGEIATSVPQTNPDLMRTAEVLGGEPIPRNPNVMEPTFNAARRAGIPVDYDEGNVLGLGAEFLGGSLLFGGPGRVKAAKELVRQGVKPLRAYAGQFGREAGNSVAAAGGSAVTQAVTKDVENPLVRGGLNMLGTMLPNLTLLGMTGAARRFGRGGDGEGLAARAAEFEAATGSKPMAHQVAGNDRMFLAARGLEMTGVGALPFARTMEGQADDFAAKTASIAGGGNKNTAVAGSAAQQGVFGPTGYIARGEKEAEGLYDAYFSQFPEGFRFSLSNTKDTLDKFINRYKNDPEFSSLLADPNFVRLRETIAANEQRVLAQGVPGGPLMGGAPMTNEVGPTIDTVRSLRTDYGRMIGRPGAGPTDTPTGDLKAIYAALSKDLEAAAERRGPQAVAAFKAADGHWKEYRTAIDDYLKPLEGMDIESMYQRVRNGKPDEVNAVMGAMGKKQQEVFTEVAINRLGLVRKKEGNHEFDVYSPNAFLRNWGDLSPRAQQALIPNATQRVQLNDMAKSFARMTKDGKVVFNSSGTTGSGQLSSQIVAAISGAATSVGGAALGSPAAAIGGAALAGTILTGMGISHWAASKMADPKWVSWLAKSNTIPVVSMPGHITRLASIDFGNEADNLSRDEVVRTLRAQFDSGRQPR